MKAAAFEYQRASSAREALELLHSYAGQAKLIAGSQSLGPMLNLRLARPAHLIDISGCEDLRGVQLQERTIRVGACITHAEIEDGLFESLRAHPLQQVASRIAYRAIRNRGTLGGSLAHADPAADWVLTAMALNAEIEIISAAGVRRVPMKQFMLAAYTTVLADKELIAAIHFPVFSGQARWGYYKFCRKTGEFAEASCAVYFEPETLTARVVVGALDAAPADLPEIAQRVASGGLATLTLADIMTALEAVTPNKDLIDRRLYANAVLRSIEFAFGSVEAA